MIKHSSTFERYSPTASTQPDASSALLLLLRHLLIYLFSFTETKGVSMPTGLRLELRRSAEGRVVDPRQAARWSALAFKQTEREDEEANAHDAQDDHAGDECTCDRVHLKRWSSQVA